MDMQKKEQMYEGKAKKVFATDDPNLVIVDYKDDATAFNGEKKGTIVGKGAINNVMSNHMFQLLEQQGVPTHFVEQLDVYKRQAQTRMRARLFAGTRKIKRLRTRTAVMIKYEANATTEPSAPPVNPSVLSSTTLHTTLMAAAAALFCSTWMVDCSSSYALLAYSVSPMKSMASAV